MHMKYYLILTKENYMMNKESKESRKEEGEEREKERRDEEESLDEWRQDDVST